MTEILKKGSDGIGIKSHEIQKLKKSKSETRLHYGQKTEMMQPG